MRRRFPASARAPALAVLVASVASVAACGPPARPRDGDTAGGAPVPAAPAAVSAPAPADSVRLALDVPTRVAAGAPVPIALRVENVAGRPVDLYLRGRAVAFDVVVTRAGGDTVWRRLEGEVVPAIVQLRTLAPGETLTLRAEWDQRTNAGAPAGAGRYVLRGLLLTDGPEPLSTPAVAIEITRGGG